MLIRKSLGLFLAGVLLSCAASASAQIVPGSGQELTELNDNFEDENWSFTLNLPKASTNIDKIDRQPAGYSANGLWFESTYRGTPDFVKRVETPEGGLPGSNGAMAMQTLYSGVPGQLSHKFQQDDLIANVSQKLGYMIPAAWTPSYVCRVYLPPFENWEQRNGSSFGFRADCQTIINKPTKIGRFFRTGGTTKEMEQYWPGFFIQFNARNHPQYPNQNTASILIRSGEIGEDIPGPTITRPGWWTLGMTITPDGKVHYYGHEGVANLTRRDHLYSSFPYGYKCLQTSTYFFNIVNQDDGRTWSTRWIVDDPKVFVATRPYTPQTAQVPAQPVSQTRPVPPAPPVSPVPATPAIPAIPAAPALPAAPGPAMTPAPKAATTLPGNVPSPVPLSTQLAPLVPQLPGAPANLAPIPPAPPAAPPAAPSTLETKPSTGGLPALQSSATPLTPAPATAPTLVAPATAPIALSNVPAPLSNQPTPVPNLRSKAPMVSSSRTVTTNSALPPLLNVPIPVAPIPVTPTKAAAGDGSPAPALLPEDSESGSAPVISTPAPAPVAPPQDDAPVLPMPTTDASVLPLLPPAAPASLSN